MIDIEVEDFNEMNSFVKKEKDLFFTNLISCIERGWKEKLLVVNVANFYIKKTGETVNVSIEEDAWHHTLHLALYHFEEVENYEYCKEINALIDKMYYNG